MGIESLLGGSLDTSSLLNQGSTNIQKELSDKTEVRKKLESSRKDMDKKVASADLKTLKEYATTVVAHKQDIFSTGYSRPSIETIMPATITSNLSSDALGSNTGELSISSLTSGLLGQYNLDLSAGGISNLAVMGADVYASSLTGGVVSPSIASSVINAVAGNYINSTVTSISSGNIASVTDTSGFSLNPSNLVSVASSSIMGDSTGSMLGGFVSTYTTKVASMLNSNNSSLLSVDSISALAGNVSGLGGGFAGSLGGINLGSIETIANGISIQGITNACKTGDVSAVSSLWASVKSSAAVVTSAVFQLGNTIAQNQDSIQQFFTILENATADYDSYYCNPARYGYPANADRYRQRVVAMGTMTGDEYSSTEDFLFSAIDSSKYNKATALGMNVVNEFVKSNPTAKTLTSAAVKKLNAIKSITSISNNKLSSPKTLSSIAKTTASTKPVVSYSSSTKYRSNDLTTAIKAAKKVIF